MRIPFRSILLALCLAGLPLAAQSSATHPSVATVSIPAAASAGAWTLDDDTFDADLFAGGGVSASGLGRPAAGQVGAAGGSRTLDRNGGAGFEQFFEVGTMGPFPARNAPAAFVGFDLGLTFLPSPRSHTVFALPGGYTYVFSQGNAINFGLSVDRYYKPYHAIRVEVRDYLTFAGSVEHNIAIRIGWHAAVHDD